MHAICNEYYLLRYSGTKAEEKSREAAKIL
jgi:hypothetical protein